MFLGNFSDLPVFNVTVQAGVLAGSHMVVDWTLEPTRTVLAPLGREEMLLWAPGSMIDKRSNTPGSGLAVVIPFLDASGRSWERNAYGTLIRPDIQVAVEEH